MSIRDAISEGVGDGTGVDAGVATNAIISESVGDHGGVDAGEVADFAGDDEAAGADPVDGDAGVEGRFESAVTNVPDWLAVMFEGPKGTFSPDCRFELAGCDSGECGL